MLSSVVSADVDRYNKTYGASKFGPYPSQHEKPKIPKFLLVFFQIMTSL